MVEGQTITELRVVEVMLPDIRSGEMWQLIGTADKISTVSLPKTETLEEQKEREAVENFLTEYRRVNAAKKKIQESLISTKADTDTLSKPEIDKRINDALIPWEKYKNLKSIPCNINGTACLIRQGNSIRIAYRQGKTANESTPNKVCINDYDKQMFFNAVKRVRGNNSGVWQLKDIDSEYDYWNKFIDNTYTDQKKNYIQFIESKETQKK